MRANSDPNRSVQANSKISRDHCEGFDCLPLRPQVISRFIRGPNYIKKGRPEPLSSPTETNPPLFDPLKSYRKTLNMFEHPALDNQSRPIKRADTIRSVKPLSGPESNNTMTMPGVRCPKCQRGGKETWVIPGKYCHICGNPC
ncbi:hypothetical protein BDV12DRAFT_165332 [Aspergillus spectabilis]